jgi:phenylacetate-CoA ligase
LDTLTVRVEERQGAGLTETVRREAAQTLAADIKAYIGVTAAIEVLAQGSIERSMGKAKRVIDNRN